MSRLKYAVKPARLQLDASTICNLNCPDCPTAHGHISKYLGSGFLSVELFRKIIDACPGLVRVELANNGEISLNPDLKTILEYADRKGVFLTALGGTNFNTVSEELLEAMVRHKFLALSCAIDGASPDTYAVYRRGGDFDKVIANIRQLNIYKKKFKTIFPLLIWQFVLFEHNRHEIEKARSMARDLDMVFLVKPDYRTVRDGAQQWDKICCLQLWQNPAINWDGRILGCCANFCKDFGSIVDHDAVLPENINNDKLAYARGMLMGEYPQRDDIPCSECRIYRQLKEKNDFIRWSDMQTFSCGIDLWARYLGRYARIGVQASKIVAWLFPAWYKKLFFRDIRDFCCAVDKS